MQSLRCYWRWFFLLLAAIGYGQDNEIDRLRQELNEIRRQADAGFARLENGLQIHGFLSQGYIKSSHYNYLTDSADGSFEFSEVGLSFSYQLTPSLMVGAQLLARDLGEFGNHKVNVDWAYGDYNVAQWLGIRVGRVKIPIGMYNEFRDMDAGRVSVLLPQSVYYEPWRDFIHAMNGLALYGNVPVGPLGDFNYQAFIGGVSLDADDGSIRDVYESSMTTLDDIAVDYVLGGALSWDTPAPGLRFHASYMRASDLLAEMTTTAAGNAYFGLPPFPPLPATEATPKYRFVSYGVEWTFGNLTLAAERLTGRGVMFLSIMGGPEYRFHDYRMGQYVMASYQVNEQLAVGAYYGEYYPDSTDPDGRDLELQSMGQSKDYQAWQKDHAIFVRYDLSDRWLMKAEYHWMYGTGGLVAARNTDSLGIPTYTTDDWQLILLKLTYMF